MNHPLLFRELRITSQADGVALLMSQPGYWNVVSIREPYHPEPVLDGAKLVMRQVFEDVLGGEASRKHAPRSAHLETILRFVDRTGAEPLLIHCWAGRSRSTAVALILMVRALWNQGIDGAELVRRAIDALLAVRPEAFPNALVLRLGLELFLPQSLAASLSRLLVQDPRLRLNQLRQTWVDADLDVLEDGGPRPVG